MPRFFCIITSISEKEAKNKTPELYVMTNKVNIYRNTIWEVAVQTLFHIPSSFARCSWYFSNDELSTHFRLQERSKIKSSLTWKIFSKCQITIFFSNQYEVGISSRPKPSKRWGVFFSGDETVHASKKLVFENLKKDHPSTEEFKYREKLKLLIFSQLDGSDNYSLLCYATLDYSSTEIYMQSSREQRLKSYFWKWFYEETKNVLSVLWKRQLWLRD